VVGGLILAVPVLHQVAALAFRALQDKDTMVEAALMVVVVRVVAVAVQAHKAQMLLLPLFLQVQTEE
jgi:hypothetical protein